MCFTVDQIDRACGLLMLSEFNSFIYCCKKCTCEFESGPHLELHILSEHQDDKEAEFVDDEVFAEIFDSRLVETGSTNIKLEHFEGSVETLEEELNKPNESQLNEVNVKKSKSLKGETTNEVSSEDDIPLADLLVNSDFNTDESNNESTMRISKCVSLAKDEVPSVKKRRGRPLGWRKRRDSNSDESFTLNRKKVYTKNAKSGPKKKQFTNTGSAKAGKSTEAVSKRPIGRPVGSKNNNYPESGVVRTYSIDEEASNRKNGRPTTGIFYCDMCPDLTFDGKMNLSKHMLHCHILQKWCDICKIRPRQSYERHMKNHHAENEYTCEICGVKIKTGQWLKAHMRIHSGEKPFLCSHCGKSFSSQASYSTHVTIMHTDIRKFKCQHCDSSFHFRYRLQDHINAFHTLEKPHVCDICGKGFSSRNYVRIHRVTHGEKELQCRYCDKMFKLSGNRIKHELLVHKVVKGNTLEQNG